MLLRRPEPQMRGSCWEQHVELELAEQTKTETDYVQGALLGKGQFGSCYRAIERSSGVEGCLKIVPKAARSRGSEEGRMLRLLRSASEPCCLRLLADPWKEDDGTNCFFMEMLAKSELTPFNASWERALHVAGDVGRALLFLERLCVVHNDIKIENIGQRGDGTCVLYDYGLAHLARSLGHVVGDARYAAPELGRLPVEHFNKGDAFSLGRTLQHLCAPAGSDWQAWMPTDKELVEGLLKKEFSERWGCSQVVAYVQQ